MAAQRECSDEGGEGRCADVVSSDDSQAASLNDLAEYLRLVSEKSFDGEMARRQSMLDTSNRLLTCDSIISVAMVSILPTMLNRFSSEDASSATAILILSFVALAFMIASLGAGLIAQYRFSYEALSRPKKLEAGIWKSRDKLETKYQIAWQYSNTLDEVQTSLALVNDRLGKLNKLSLVLLGVALGIAMFTCIVFLILLFV